MANLSPTARVAIIGKPFLLASTSRASLTSRTQRRAPLAEHSAWSQVVWEKTVLQIPLSQIVQGYKGQQQHLELGIEEYWEPVQFP